MQSKNAENMRDEDCMIFLDPPRVGATTLIPTVRSIISQTKIDRILSDTEIILEKRGFVQIYALVLGTQKTRQFGSKMGPKIN